ncbi:MAG: outer membrane lipoprotein-sorting protein [Deltaproteobacteria bacterium]|nr:outer membrane lipoprotein-sorting protein [Deltaproteobacteria bacterium]
MRKLLWLVSVVVFVFGVSPANAGHPDGKTIIQKSDEAISAWRSGTRRLVITTKVGTQVTSEWVARNSYKEFPDGKRALLVILEPESLKGAAHLFWKRTDNTTEEWAYYPAVRRVKRLSGLTAYDSFFGTDFTYADLGIRDLHGTHGFLSEEIHASIKAYKVETIPKEQCYYSRIISWIAVDTFLPIQRDYYDPTGRHWKTKLFEDVVTIDNIPKPIQVRMLDHIRNHRTVITVSDFCYDVESLTKETFSPEKLSEAVSSSVCTVNVLKKR